MSTQEITRFIVRGQHGGAYSIAVEGPLDASSASSLRFLLLDLQRDRVTLDLTDCTALTDEAMVALVDAARRAEARGGDLRLLPAGVSAGQDRAEPTAAGPTRRSLTPAESLDLLARASIGRIAVTRVGVPHVVPVNYAVVDGAVLFRSVPGSKLAACDSGAPVSFEVDEFDLVRHVGWSVLVSGRTELVTGEEELERVGGRLDSWVASPTDCVVRILPDLVSGCIVSDGALELAARFASPQLTGAGLQ